MITIYGIPNCTSVKKTRAWCDENGVAYVFHDFKKQGIDEATLKAWLDTIPLETLVNKKGTTWRGLSPELQSQAAQANTAIELMMSHTSIIKRPVVVCGGQLFVGHDEAALSALKSSLTSLT